MPPNSEDPLPKQQAQNYLRSPHPPTHEQVHIPKGWRQLWRTAGGYGGSAPYDTERESRSLGNFASD